MSPPLVSPHILHQHFIMYCMPYLVKLTNWFSNWPIDMLWRFSPFCLIRSVNNQKLTVTHISYLDRKSHELYISCIFLIQTSIIKSLWLVYFLSRPPLHEDICCIFILWNRNTRYESAWIDNNRQWSAPIGSTRLIYVREILLET